MTTIDRRVRVERYVEYWVPDGANAKDVSKILLQASREWHEEHSYAWEPGRTPVFDDWFTIHPDDEHVIIRIKCPDEAS